MSFTTFLAFLEYVLIYSYTPGPANLFALKVGSQYGYKHFLKVYPGLFSGCLVIMAISNVFINSCQRIVPDMMIFFHYLGTLYILWVAFHIFRSKPISVDETNGELSKKPTFVTGFILNISNMKIMIFGITLMQMYEMPYCNTAVESILFTVGIAFLISTSTLLWGYCGKMLSNFLQAHFKVCHTVMAALLVSCLF